MMLPKGLPPDSFRSQRGASIREAWSRVPFPSGAWGFIFPARPVNARIAPMHEMTHRIFYHDAIGFFGKRPLGDDDARDEDGYPVWNSRDDALLLEKATTAGTDADSVREDVEIIHVAFVPKAGFEGSDLEPLTDDGEICPAGTWAAFPSIR